MIDNNNKTNKRVQKSPKVRFLLVLGIVFFLIYHIISKTGEMLADAGSLPPWMGMWMSTAMLLPIAGILIRQARNDAQIFSKEWYLRRWFTLKRFFNKSKQSPAKTT